MGDRRLAPDLKRFFAARGFAMASIEYRLTGEAIFPAQLHDVKTAIRWLRSVASQYGFDGERIGVWGSSAGGHLAALTAPTGDSVMEPERPEHGEFSTRVAAVVEGYGPMDFLRMDEQRPKPGTFTEDPEAAHLPKGPPAASPDSPESRLIGAPIHTRPDIARTASPLAYAKAGAPPFLILHGRSDSLVPMGQSELLFDALAATGNEATLLLIDGIGHAFLGRQDGWGDGRATTLRHTAGGKTDADRVGPTASYALIEDFFRQHLAD